MKLLKYTLGILCLSFLACCQTRQASGNIDDIVAGIINFPEENVGDASTILDTITYIPLNESEEALISIPTKMIIFDGHFFIFDRFSRNTLCEFDEKGNFVRQIGKRGEGGSEYRHAWDFDVDSNGVYVYDNRGKQIIKYSRTGEFVNAKKIDGSLKGFAKIKDGFLLGLYKTEGREDESEILVTDSNLNVITSYLPFDSNYKDDRMTDNLFRRSGNNIVYHRPINDNVYIFDNSGKVTKTLKVSFNKFGIPDELKNSYQTFVNSKGKEKYNYAYDSPIIDANYIIYSIFINGNKGTAIYDANSNSFHIKEMNPILSKIKISDILFPMAYDNNIVYSILDESITDVLIDNNKIPSDLQSHLENGNKIICLYHLKK